MRTKMFLAAMCLSMILCTQAFSNDCAPRGGHFRAWVKAVFTVQCKTCRHNPPAPEPAAKDAPKEEPKEAPKTDAAPAPSTPAPNKTGSQGST